MRISDFEQTLGQYSRLGLDTSIFIYSLERNPRYHELTQTILRKIESGDHHGVTSVITLMELTVRPWQQSLDKIARTYETYLINYPNLRMSSVDRHIARKASQLRGSLRLRPADALQIATAIVGEADVWITNDKQHRQVEPMLDVLILEDFVSAN